MGIRTSQPPYMKKPMLLFAVGFIVYSLLVVAAFYLTAGWLSQASDWRPYVAAIPGAVLSGFFILLYAYMRHNDELVRQITLKSLAVACLLGVSAQLISITRARIGGYSEFEGATIIFVMAVTFLVVALLLSWRHR